MQLQDKDTPTCIICLQEPLEKSPLLLLACGCQVSWFHDECERVWLNHRPLDLAPPTCPVCRRQVQMKTNYCYSIWAGPSQRDLWVTLLFMFSEYIFAAGGYLSGAEYAPVLPIQSLSLLSMPFVFRQKENILFYLHHVCYRAIYYSFFLLLHLANLQNKSFPYTKAVNFILFFGHFHVCLLFFTRLVSLTIAPNEKIDVFFPFAISREILHVKTLEVAPSSTSSPPSKKSLGSRTKRRGSTSK